MTPTPTLLLVSWLVRSTASFSEVIFAPFEVVFGFAVKRANRFDSLPPRSILCRCFFVGLPGATGDTTPAFGSYVRRTQ